MQRLTKLALGLAVLLVGGGATALYVAKVRSESASAEIAKVIAMTWSDKPGTGLPADWIACLERAGAAAPSRTICTTTTANGLTSELVAIKAGNSIVPVIQTRRVDAAPGPVIIELVGGPGGSPFHIEDILPADVVAEWRRKGFTVNGQVKQAAYVGLLQGGFTIASVGYWGTAMRTLDAPDEMQLAIGEVRAVVDYYRDRDGAEPALITTSLGNHLALGALGQARLEGMDVLALVPVMDGLQHHLRRVAKETARQREKARASGKPFGQWTMFHIYKDRQGQRTFDHAGMLGMIEYVPRYMGKADYPWMDVRPSGPCSRIILGDRDPRTRDFLAANRTLPPFITVLPADHDLFADAGKAMLPIVERYGDCLKTRRLGDAR